MQGRALILFSPRCLPACLAGELKTVMGPEGVLLFAYLPAASRFADLAHRSIPLATLRVTMFIAEENRTELFGPKLENKRVDPRERASITQARTHACPYPCCTCLFAV